MQNKYLLTSITKRKKNTQHVCQSVGWVITNNKVRLTVVNFHKMTEYGKVVLTLSTVFLPPEKLYPNPTPSTLEGLPWDVEYDLRLIGCELIQTACLLLKLPQVIPKRWITSFVIDFDWFSDGSSYWSSIIPSLLLYIFICSSSCWNLCYGLYKSCC